MSLVGIIATAAILLLVFAILKLRVYTHTSGWARMSAPSSLPLLVHITGGIAGAGLSVGSALVVTAAGFAGKVYWWKASVVNE